MYDKHEWKILSGKQDICDIMEDGITLIIEINISENKFIIKDIN